MANLMIGQGGALGDTGYLVPAMRELRTEFDEIYMCGKPQCGMALENTGLVDRFVIKPHGSGKWDVEFMQTWLMQQTADIDFEYRANIRGAVASRYMFHAQDPKFNKDAKWKREINEGVNYFDSTSMCVKVLGREGVLINGVPEAVGKRPTTCLTHKERGWLRDFRYIHNIPKDAFLLGWQFTGSSMVKWYPYFKEVIQEAIMQSYPEVYVVGLGDMKDLLSWKKDKHGGRFTNLGSSISFRQAYILTSILDLLVSPETGVFVFSQGYPTTPKILLASHTSGKHICCGDETTILQPSCPCSPCYNIVATCTTDEESGAALCMATIEPERVIEVIEREIGIWVFKDSEVV